MLGGTGGQSKLKSLEVTRKHGVSPQETQEIFDQVFLVAAWKATKEEAQSYAENI
jgi:uncharacterized DUF497 family protein